MSLSPELPSETHHLVYVKRRVSHKPAAGDMRSWNSWALEALDRPLVHIFGHRFLAKRLEQEQSQRHVLWWLILGFGVLDLVLGDQGAD